MKFSLMSDGIRLHHAHQGYDDDEPDGAAAGAHGLPAGPGALVTDGVFFGHHAHVNYSAAPELAQGHIASEHHAAAAGSLAATPGPGPLDPGGGGGSIESGGNSAGNGGDGYFSGDIVHASLLIYEPVNIAVELGYGSVALASQTNNVSVDQSATQIAGVGGSGGDGNIAVGGSAGLLSGILPSHGVSDTIDTGSNSAGNGGDGHFTGSLIDVDVAIYAPINIAIAGPHATAEADQINNVHLDQGAVQIAGVGGDGGSGNLALGGAAMMHLSPDFHLVG